MSKENRTFIYACFISLVGTIMIYSQMVKIQSGLFDYSSLCDWLNLLCAFYFTIDGFIKLNKVTD